MNRIIKLSDEHYIGVDDSEKPVEGDWIAYTNLNHFVPVQYLGGDLTGGEKKITHSSKPLDCNCAINNRKLDLNCAERNHCFNKIKPLSLSEIEEVIHGCSVEKISKEILPDDADWKRRFDIIKGLKDKLFTIEDMLTAFQTGYNSGAELDKYAPKCGSDFVKTILPKTEWNVEIDEQGKIKRC